MPSRNFGASPIIKINRGGCEDYQATACIERFTSSRAKNNIGLWEDGHFARTAG